jgi:propanediol dehydratase small subunit
MSRKLTVADYPLAETAPKRVTGQRGKPLSAITLDAVLAGDVTMEDLRITPQALKDQAAIAQSAGRSRLSQNFLRAADLVGVPQEVIMETYELLRPGRAASKDVLLAQAALLRRDYKAKTVATFIEEAADVYEQRGLFKVRY